MNEAFVSAIDGHNDEKKAVGKRGERGAERGGLAALEWFSGKELKNRSDNKKISQNKGVITEEHYVENTWKQEKGHYLK